MCIHDTLPVPHPPPALAVARPSDLWSPSLFSNSPPAVFDREIHCQLVEFFNRALQEGGPRRLINRVYYNRKPLYEQYGIKLYASVQPPLGPSGWDFRDGTPKRRKSQTDRYVVGGDERLPSLQLEETQGPRLDDQQSNIVRSWVQRAVEGRADEHA